MKASRKTAKRLLSRRYDAMDLEQARHYYWLGDYTKASAILFPLVKRIVVEPLANTEEYKDGERKSPPPLDEPQEEKEERQSFYEHLFGEEGPVAEEERDDAGYIVERNDAGKLVSRRERTFSYPSEQGLEEYDGHPII